eukprot:scaffold6.g2728.t1
MAVAPAAQLLARLSLAPGAAPTAVLLRELPLEGQLEALLLLRAAPHLFPAAGAAGLAQACCQLVGDGQGGAEAPLGSDILHILVSEVQQQMPAEQHVPMEAAALGPAPPPCPAFLYSAGPAFPWAPALHDSDTAQVALAATAAPATPGKLKRRDVPAGAQEEQGGKRPRTEPGAAPAAAAAASQQQQQAAAGAADDATAAAAALRAALEGGALAPGAPLPPEARQALDGVLALAAAGSEGALQQAGLAALPDEALLRLTSEAVGPSTSFVRCAAVARGMALPRALALAGPPSRDLAAALAHVGAANPRALIAACLQPLLASPGFGGPQAELVMRLLKDTLPEQLLPELLAAACAPPPHGAAPGAHWTEHTVGVLAALLSTKTPLPPGTLAALVTAAHGACAGELRASAKWAKLLLNLAAVAAQLPHIAAGWVKGAGCWQWQPSRGLSASAAQAQASGAGEGGDGQQQKAPVALAAPADADSASGTPAETQSQEDGYDEEELEAFQGIQSAFDQLISAAYELLSQGKAGEAEYLLAEGARQAEEVLGADALELAPLYDQLAILLFLHEREDEAVTAARRALEVLEKHDEPNGPASAIAGVRYAGALLACGEAQEAQLVLAKSVSGLRRALDWLGAVQAESEADQEDLAEAASKFETGLGEGLAYRALARLALAGWERSAAAAQEGELQEGLALMKRHLGMEHALVGALLREHNRLLNGALEGGKNDFAEALYEQARGGEVRLHAAYGPDPEHQSLLQYQLGTLQARYVMGKYKEAQASLEASLAGLEALQPAAGTAEGGKNDAGARGDTAGDATGEKDEEGPGELEGQLLSVKQRLGVILGAAGEHEAARRLLYEVAPDLVEKAGPSNPLTHELNAVLSLVSLRELPPDAAPERKQKLLQEMEVNIAKLVVYGEEHMLVAKARALFEGAAGRPPRALRDRGAQD